MTHRIDHTGHNHPASPAARAACRKIHAAREVIIQDRIAALVAGAESFIFGREEGLQYLRRAAVRLGLSDSLSCGYLFAARALATYSADLGGGRRADGRTYSDIMRMYS